MYTQFQNGKQLNFLASEKFTAFPETVNKDNYNVKTDDLGRKYIPAVLYIQLMMLKQLVLLLMTFM